MRLRPRRRLGLLHDGGAAERDDDADARTRLVPARALPEERADLLRIRGAAAADERLRDVVGLARVRAEPLAGLAELLEAVTRLVEHLDRRRGRLDAGRRLELALRGERDERLLVAGGDRGVDGARDKSTSCDRSSAASCASHGSSAFAFSAHAGSVAGFVALPHAQTTISNAIRFISGIFAQHDAAGLEARSWPDWASASERGAVVATQEKVRIHRPPSLPGIELWSTQVVATEFSMITPGYLFGSQDLGTEPRAVGWCRIGTRTCEVTGDERLLIANPGECVRSVVTGPREVLSYHQLFVEPAYVERYLDEAPRGELGTISVTRMDVLESFARAWRAIESADRDGIEVEQHVRRFLTDVFALASDRPARARATGCDLAVRRVRALLDDRFAEPLTLAEIALASGLSLFHLEHAFREKTGVAIHQYLKLVRLRRAMELLGAGQRPVDVAAACGFADQAHMGRIFRRTLSLTPGEIRAALSRKSVQGSDATDC